MDGGAASGPRRERPRAFEHVAPSRILTALPKTRLAPFRAVRVPGRVVWLDRELASRLGMTVPLAGLDDAAFHEDLLDAFSLAAAPRGRAPKGSVELFADRYGGIGLATHAGSARGGFLPYGDLFLKGIGKTPLFRRPKDFFHAHGGATMLESMIEAMFGLVLDNLFERGAARVLALVDQEGFLEYPDGSREPRMVLVRAGLQLRPAHALEGRDGRFAGSRRAFVDMTRATGQLALRRGAPDLAATLRCVLDDHARSAADQVRYRVAHGGLSASNMLLGGGALDTAWCSTQPRTAPMRLTDYPDPKVVFGREHEARAEGLAAMAAAATLAPAAALDVRKEHARLYQKHLARRWLTAMGWKRSAAELLATTAMRLVRRLTRALDELAALVNPSDLATTRLVEMAALEGVSVVDVFAFLAAAPPLFFARGELSVDEARGALQVDLRGEPKASAKNEARLAKLVPELARAYGALMLAGREAARELYDDDAAMVRSITARAAFTNAPIPALYRPVARDEILDVIAKYVETDDASELRRALDLRVAASLRNPDALVDAGFASGADDGTTSFQGRFLDGVMFSVRSRASDGAACAVGLEIPFERERGVFRTWLPGRPSLQKGEPVLARATFDRGATFVEAPGVVVLQKQRRGRIVFRPLPAPLVGRVSVDFVFGDRVVRDGAAYFGRYVFALPDREEQRALAER